MTQTGIRYRFNTEPRRWLAVAGAVFLKPVLLAPHLIALVALEAVTVVAMYAGWVWTAVTGRLPIGIQQLVAATMGWWVRVRAWYLGVTDEYPPFELRPPADYLPALDVEPTDDPSRWWAALAIVAVKVVAVLPFLILMVILEAALLIVAWVAAIIVLATGRLPVPLQDFCIGTGLWGSRVVMWLAGIDRPYPRFDLEVHPIDHTVQVTVSR